MKSRVLALWLVLSGLIGAGCKAAIEVYRHGGNQNGRTVGIDGHSLYCITMVVPGLAPARG
jgi:hypothetical protein